MQSRAATGLLRRKRSGSVSPQRQLPLGGPRGALLLGADGLAASVALALAFWLRFEGRVPPAAERLIPYALPLVAGVRIACSAAWRIHHWSFRLASLSEALRVAAAGFSGSLCLVLLWPVAFSQMLPRSIGALELFASLTLLSAVRFGPRAALGWRCQLAQARTTSPRTVVVGLGGAAELLVREILQRPAGNYHLVGLVADDPSMLGCQVAGLPVLGHVDELPALLQRHCVSMVLLARGGQSDADIRRVLDLTGGCRVRIKVIPAPLEQVESLSAAMLNDVRPEHLLARAPVSFEESGLRRLVRGRRALVTGAGGSIGAELCRQLARLGAAQLVMADINENELYLGARRLGETCPELEVHPVVVDVRERVPLQRLGARFRPQDVFHAAAHKHVPLMETVPEEAVKNNVFGTLNVAMMADHCGAERMVLISTDKAVRPTSVMGATKRVAEMVIRHVGSSSTTRMAAVRFGNVLGSAGSVIPLFRQQIAQGGPVTVTHPDCTRYFMTVPEAVGLILRAGLGCRGELFVLEMGKPVRIDDLARNIITLSGHVVGDEIAIVYTGLRPGEKLTEELLSVEEERTEKVVDRIHVADCPPPPADFAAQLARLRRAAMRADQGALREALRSLVPTFLPLDLVPAEVPIVRAGPVARATAGYPAGGLIPVLTGSQPL